MVKTSVDVLQKAQETSLSSVKKPRQESMLSDSQKAILKLLRELWERHPQQRLGQILENYVFYNGQRGDKTSVALFFQYDLETLKVLQNRLGEKCWEGRKE